MLTEIKEISLYLPYSTNGDEAYWLFAIRLEDRDKLIIYLKSTGIATGVHFYPLTMQPLYKKYDIHCNVANTIWKEFLTLPSHADLSEEEIDYVIDHLKTFYRNK